MLYPLSYRGLWYFLQYSGRSPERHPARSGSGQSWSRNPRRSDNAESATVGLPSNQINGSPLPDWRNPESNDLKATARVVVHSGCR